MIQIKDKKDCCGCSACECICAKHCITMMEDAEGFLYPEVDVTACTNYELCERICPVLNVPHDNSVMTAQRVFAEYISNHQLSDKLYKPFVYIRNVRYVSYSQKYV